MCLSCVQLCVQSYYDWSERRNWEVGVLADVPREQKFTPQRPATPNGAICRLDAILAGFYLFFLS